MAKYLREIAKKGTMNTSHTIVGGDNSSESGKVNIDDLNAAPGNRDFAKQHTTQKWADRDGNDEKVFKGGTKQTSMKNHGYKDPADDKVYQKANEEVELDEVSSQTVDSYIKKAKSSLKDLQKKGDERKAYYRDDSIRMATRKLEGGNAKVMAKEGKGMMCEACGTMYEGESCGCGKSMPEAKPGKKGMIVDKKKLNEILSKKMSAGDVISDFVHSDNPKFEGKSKKERMKMALGAYYSMHPEKSKKKMKTEQAAPADTPMKLTYPSDEVGQVGRV